ncbi:hypothetical protein [Acidisphaera sp. S103]|uniref:hypothetical protein n=1 Tax=Acidisphaera sp. S103 TaxID=1747223 RepID=UPI00131C7F11|nr:hypothetical protein [Acidisphaera sp. S103]
MKFEDNFSFDRFDYKPRRIFRGRVGRFIAFAMGYGRPFAAVLAGLVVIDVGMDLFVRGDFSPLCFYGGMIATLLVHCMAFVYTHPAQLCGLALAFAGCCLLVRASKWIT